jgi:hypothetical protein
LPNSNNEKQRAERQKPPCPNRESVSCAVWSFNGHRVGLKLCRQWYVRRVNSLEISPHGELRTTTYQTKAAWGQRDSQSGRIDRLSAEGHRGSGRLEPGGVDILAQKYFRKAGVPARLKKVEENSVPSWLWRSVPKTEERWPSCRRTSATVRNVRASRSSDRLAGTWTYWGWKGGYFDLRRRRARLLSTSCSYMLATQRARRTPRSGSTPACTGPTASTAPARATSMSISKPAS